MHKKYKVMEYPYRVALLFAFFVFFDDRVTVHE
jgi:hypothetical protein